MLCLLTVSPLQAFTSWYTQQQQEQQLLPPVTCGKLGQSDLQQAQLQQQAESPQTAELQTNRVPLQHASQQPASSCKQHRAACSTKLQSASKLLGPKHADGSTASKSHNSTHAQQQPRMQSQSHGSSLSLLWCWMLVAVMLSQAAPTRADSLGTCPVSINYAVSLGQGSGDYSNVPVFVGSVGVMNNANVSMHSG